MYVMKNFTISCSNYHYTFFHEVEHHIFCVKDRKINKTITNIKNQEVLEILYFSKKKFFLKF